VATVAAMAPEYMTEPLEETAAGAIDFTAVDRVLDFKADVIAIGPGLGRDPSTVAFIQAIVERSGVPLVLDADALNAFADDPDRLMGRDGVDVIITPHPGEMARLLNVSIEQVESDRIQHAREYAATHRVHVVLKGRRAARSSTSPATPAWRRAGRAISSPG
jgi:NAD(P)H-hydrate epimerase